MNWRFFLDGNPVEEPLGWKNLGVKLARDARFHGVFSEFTTKTLGFSCDGAELILNKYNALGVDAKLTLDIEYRCDFFSPWQNFFSGVLVVSNLRRTEGLLFVECTVEEDSVAMRLRTRYDVPVDLLADKCLDGATPVTAYTHGLFPARISSAGSSQPIKKTYRARLNAACINDVIGRNFGIYGSSMACPVRFGQNNSPNFSTSSSYQPNDVVLLIGPPPRLYRANTATGPGPFNPAHWDELPFNAKTALSYAVERLVAEVHQFQPSATTITVQQIIDGQCMAIDSGALIVDGTNGQGIETFGHACVTATTLLNDMPGTQPQGSGMVQVYRQDVADGLHGLTLGGTTNEEGSQSSSPLLAFFVAPEPGEYKINIECDLSVSAIFGAICEKEVVYATGNGPVPPPQRRGQNNFYQAELALIYDNGATVTTLHSTIATKSGNTSANCFGQNAVAVNALSWPISISETLTMTAGQELKLYFLLRIRGRYVRTSVAGDTEPINGIGVLRTTSSSCCVEIVKESLADDAADLDIAVFPPYETANRIVESITLGLAKVRSSLLGRPDGQPYVEAAYGCASLACITNGYYIRGYGSDPSAPNPPPVVCGVDLSGDEYERLVFKRIHVSLKDFFEAFDAIYCIGLGVEWPSGDVVIESREYFYPPGPVLMTIPAVDPVQLGLEMELDASRIWNSFKSGYTRWESESINGTIEYNTRRHWYLPIETFKNELARECRFIASGYTFETTRRQSIALTGTRDYKYDENVFVLQLRDLVPATSPAYSTLERGVGPTAANVVNAPTQINWRLRPAVMARRWLPWLAQSMFHAPASPGWLKLAFGSANVDAQGSDAPHPFLPAACNFPQTVENEALDITFAPGPSYLRPEIYTLTYRLSVQDYLAIKANPYGLIRLQFQWGNVDCHIQSLEYNISNFEGKFRLMPRS